MIRTLGRFLAHNVLALVALTAALGGTAYAAATVGSAQIVNGSVKSVDVKNGSLQGADLAQAPWRTVATNEGADDCSQVVGTFCTGWRNWGEAFENVRFRRDATGEVTLQGLLDWDASSNERRVFVLPAGYRPSAYLIFPVGCGTWETPGDTTGVVEIRSNGEVAWRGGDSCDPDNWVSLSGISFPAA